MATNSSGTGTRDTTFNLMSVSYHCLQGAETCGQYLEDAQRAGDQELTGFFREAQQMQRDCADRAKKLLKQHISAS